MNNKRQIEIFSAGCPLCKETINMVNQMACASCEVHILDMNKQAAAKRANELGVKSVPAVAINGQLADCCTGQGINETTLRKAGIGVETPEDV